MSQKRILVVEDESIVAMEIEDRLQGLGYQVLAVIPSGEEAIQKTEELKPDLILMDIMLQGDLDGIETSHQILQKNDLPIIFLTAHSDAATLERAKKTAPFGYLIKPFEEQELFTAIETALYRHKMEKKLKESEEWLKITLSSIGDALIATDKNGRIKFINPVAESLTGWKQDDAFEKDFNEICNIINEETGLEQDNPVSKVLETGQTIHLANHSILISKDGREYPIEDSAAPIKDADGVLTGVVLVFSDVSERVRMTKALRQSEQKYRSFAENFNGIAFQVGMDYKPIFVNGAVEAITGYTEEDFMNLNPAWDKIINPDDFKAIVASRDVGKITDNETNSHNEYRIIRKDGEIHWVQSSIQVIFDDSGKPVKMQGIITDINDRKLMEAELIRSQKLESLGVLAGGIAHDFNNLLTGIFGNIGLAKVYMQPEDKSYKRLVESEKALVRAKDLTQQLLIFSKGGSPVLRTIDITDVIRTSASFALRGSNVNFAFYFDPDLWPVDFDEGQLSQVIQNLVINADHAMRDGGKVSIRCKNIVLQQDDSTMPVGNYVRIVVTDEGTGIKPEDLKNIFDPYFTTKEHGSGLGLATVYSIVKSHNAHVSVDSVLGKGTSFEILISASASGITKAADDPKPESLQGPGKVLIMDDQDIILEFMEMALTEFGYKVDLAFTGSEAIQKYKEAMGQNKPYDLLIMDLTVPGGMGGKEALAELLRIDPDVKAIVSSGYADNPVMSEYKKYGFSAVLKKPYKIKELAGIVKQVISND